MRCGCPACGAYMAHSEGLELGCVCPECKRRCKLCLGSDTALDREQLSARREALAARDWNAAFNGNREDADE